MVVIGSKPTKNAETKYTPEFSDECLINSYPAELVQVRKGTPFTLTGKEVKPLTPVVKGQGEKFGFFQYVEINFNGTQVGARVMMKTETAQISGKEKSLELSYMGPTLYGTRIILGFNRE